MILGTGIDLAKVSRYKNLLEKDGFLHRFFHDDEIEYIQSRGAGAAQTLAGCFAAREAFFKALGTGFAGFATKDIKVERDEKGKPYIVTTPKVDEHINQVADKWNIHLSISHEKEYAIAQVILEAL